MFIDQSDIFVLTETWLHGEITDSELKLPNYEIYRKERMRKILSGTNEAENESVRGGGVLIGVSKQLKSSCIGRNLLPNDSVLSEELFIKVSVGKKKFILQPILNLSRNTMVTISL